MKYFSSLLIILAIMAFGYAFGTLRYTTLGCRRAARWGRRRDRGLKTLLVVAIVPSTIAVVYGPTYHFHLWFGFEPDEALLFSVFWSLAAITLIGATIVRLVDDGEYNSKVSANRAARACCEDCRYACEAAGWGQTTLDCCQNLHCSCPLAAEYDIRVKLHKYDVLAAFYGEMSRQRRLRRQGKPVPTTTHLEVSCERVLTKEFTAEGWYDVDLSQQFSPVAPATAKIIPFPGTVAAVEPDVIAVEPEVIPEKPTPVRRAKCQKVSITRKDHGIMVKDCGDHLLLRMQWTDEEGKVRRDECTIEKSSADDCAQVVKGIAAVDANAARQVEYMIAPIIALRG